MFNILLYNNKPYKNVSGKPDTKPLTMDECLDWLYNMYCIQSPSRVCPPTRRPTGEYITNDKLLLYLRNHPVGRDFPFEKAYWLMSKLEEVIPTYKNLLYGSLASEVYFLLVRNLTFSKEHRDKVISSVIQFTKDKLFEIFLVDDMIYRSICRGFYRVKGFEYQKNLPFYNLRYQNNEIYYPRVWGFCDDPHFLEKNQQFKPYALKYEYTYKYNHCIAAHPNSLFIIPAFFIYYAATVAKDGENISADAEIYSKYIPCIEEGTKILRYIDEDRIYYNDYTDPDRHPFNKGIYMACSGNQKSRKEFASDALPSPWYGLSYWSALCSKEYDLRVKAAEVAMEAPVSEGYTVDMIKIPGKSDEECQHERHKLKTRIVQTMIVIISAAVSISVLYLAFSTTAQKALFDLGVKILSATLIPLIFIFIALSGAAGDSHPISSGGHRHDGPDYSSQTWKQLYLGDYYEMHK